MALFLSLLVNTKICSLKRLGSPLFSLSINTGASVSNFSQEFSLAHLVRHGMIRMFCKKKPTNLNQTWKLLVLLSRRLSSSKALSLCFRPKTRVHKGARGNLKRCGESIRSVANMFCNNCWENVVVEEIEMPEVVLTDTMGMSPLMSRSEMSLPDVGFPS
ncbi:hypothetical protein PHYBLDRAFT_60819 [Phycomyces blakesleeanus NRRL 1555(-)]|uniref:Uncharacterized protein n=1 Tax=Phycomyces blakesleeanus (strain ATCC 8743b / DSM 1359 / FGSC 10004 / NBRC 33097 / NRRL 1555) TaxID=763407 RepID=A0A163B163_PHYB8|nr:hypothetical protein PHYBLDRAFT_60819 [Phycomyces blakesleeanus NRRL 1555(-)]OAD77691.1 hypothetical protein PHYBLDRAFT_60819 [Phycomyces blakesleeanus NRRL 1555(-)]|eukprot:XP_018295731.1 hypothetical protein PHYBLDRAFT_60819 [Phycomyces blakesleeanus NRRL 1555(-)]